MCQPPTHESCVHSIWCVSLLRMSHVYTVSDVSASYAWVMCTQYHLPNITPIIKILFLINEFQFIRTWRCYNNYWSVYTCGVFTSSQEEGFGSDGSSSSGGGGGSSAVEAVTILWLAVRVVFSCYSERVCTTVIVCHWCSCIISSLFFRLWTTTRLNLLRCWESTWTLWSGCTVRMTPVAVSRTTSGLVSRRVEFLYLDPTLSWAICNWLQTDQPLVITLSAISPATCDLKNTVAYICYQKNLPHSFMQSKLIPLKVDGHDCSPTPIGKTLANLGYASQVHNEHRSVESKWNFTPSVISNWAVIISVKAFLCMIWCHSSPSLFPSHHPSLPLSLSPSLSRSEERRVGKECRSRWSPYH